MEHTGLPAHNPALHLPRFLSRLGRVQLLCLRPSVLCGAISYHGLPLHGILRPLCLCWHRPSCPERSFSTLPTSRSSPEVPLSEALPVLSIKPALPQAPGPVLSSLLCQNTCLPSMAATLFMGLSVCPRSLEPRGSALSDSWPSVGSGQHQGACAKQP